LVCKPDPTNIPMQNNTVAPAITKRMISVILRTALRRHDNPVQCHDYFAPAPEGRLCSVPSSAGPQIVGGCSLRLLLWDQVRPGSASAAARIRRVGYHRSK
jgi:hypothetical protein